MTESDQLTPERPHILSFLVMSVLALACLGLLLSVTLPTGSRTWSSIQNVGHFFIFALMAFIYMSQIMPLLSGKLPHSALATIVLLTTIGLLAEAVQTYLPERSASIDDLARNFAGVFVGLSLYVIFFSRDRIPKQQLVAIALLAASIFILVVKPSTELVTYSLLKSGPPKIISLDDWFVTSMISTTGGAKSALDQLKTPNEGQSQRVLRMDFAQEPYSGVILHRPGKQWPVSGELTIRLYNGGASREMALRIHDELHNNNYTDRFNTKFNVVPGENTVLIPLEQIRKLGTDSGKRIMDMQNITELQIFSSKRESFTLYLKEITIKNEK